MFFSYFLYFNQKMKFLINQKINKLPVKKFNILKNNRNFQPS